LAELSCDFTSPAFDGSFWVLELLAEPVLVVLPELEVEVEVVDPFGLEEVAGLGSVPEAEGFPLGVVAVLEVVAVEGFVGLAAGGVEEEGAGVAGAGDAGVDGLALSVFALLGEVGVLVLLTLARIWLIMSDSYARELESKAKLPLSVLAPRPTLPSPKLERSELLAMEATSL
jgi:hypothetical protein